MNFIQNLIVGIILLGALSILGFFTIVSEAGPFSKEGTQIIIMLDNAGGLEKGSDVTLLGILVGHVEEILLVPVDNNNRLVSANSSSYSGHKVAVVAGIDEPFPFYGNYKIQVRNESLLATKVIYIDPGSPVSETSEPERILSVLYLDRKLLKKNKVTAAEYLAEKKKMMKIDELRGEAGREPMNEISKILAENERDVQSAVDNIAEITEKSNSGNGTLSRLINDDELHYRAHTLVNDAEIVVRETRKNTEDERERAPVKSLFKLF